MQMFIQVVNVENLGGYIFFQSVLGIWDIATEVAQGSIVQHNKSRVATGEIDDIAYIYLEKEFKKFNSVQKN